MADLLILAIETATGCGGVSLTSGDRRDGRVLAEYTLQPDIAHSRRLLGLIAAMMTATALSWDSLDGVAISQGPGSFTGLRIGMAAAKGIAMAAGVPLLGVSTLDGLAAQVPGLSLPLCCLLDARKQQVYAGFYHCVDGDGHYRRTGDPLVLSPSALINRIEAPTLVAGPGIAACAAQLAAHPLARLLPSAALHPRAALIGFLAAEDLAAAPVGSGGPVGEQAELVPSYVRASEAELSLR